MSSKDIRIAAQSKLDAAEDNFYRATAAFQHLPPEEMAKEYGQSGETRAQILEGYKKELERWKKALKLAS